MDKHQRFFPTIEKLPQPRGEGQLELQGSTENAGPAPVQLQQIFQPMHQTISETDNNSLNSQEHQVASSAEDPQKAGEVANVYRSPLTPHSFYAGAIRNDKIFRCALYKLDSERFSKCEGLKFRNWSKFRDHVIAHARIYFCDNCTFRSCRKDRIKNHNCEGNAVEEERRDSLKRDVGNFYKFMMEGKRTSDEVDYALKNLPDDALYKIRYREKIVSKPQAQSLQKQKACSIRSISTSQPSQINAVVNNALNTVAASSPVPSCTEPTKIVGCFESSNALGSYSSSSKCFTVQGISSGVGPGQSFTQIDRGLGVLDEIVSPMVEGIPEYYLLNTEEEQDQIRFPYSGSGWEGGGWAGT